MENIEVIFISSSGKIIEVTKHDLPTFFDAYGYVLSDFHYAKLECERLGPGWRLPTRDELWEIYNQIHKLGKGDFNAEFYFFNDDWQVDDCPNLNFKNGEWDNFGEMLCNGVLAVRSMVH